MKHILNKKVSPLLETFFFAKGRPKTDDKWRNRQIPMTRILKYRAAQCFVEFYRF